MISLTKRKLLQACGAGVMGMGALRILRPPEARLRRYTVEWPLAAPVRVAHLTDLHIGATTPKRTLRAALASVQAARPDLVLLTGDYLNRSLKHKDELAAFVAQLPGKVIATLGNHDHWSGAEAISEALGRQGVVVLRNEPLWLEEHGLQLVGIDDGHTGHHDIARAFDGATDAENALVLQHTPALADAIAARGGRLILSGHTHGGQLAVPKLTKRIMRRLGQHYPAGWYHVGPARLFVNAGLGHSPFRAGDEAQPEVVLFDLLPPAA